MYTYIYICVHAYIYANKCVYMKTRVHIYARKYIHFLVYIDTYIHTYMHTYLFINLYTFVWMILHKHKKISRVQRTLTYLIALRSIVIQMTLNNVWKKICVSTHPMLHRWLRMVRFTTFPPTVNPKALCSLPQNRSTQV